MVKKITKSIIGEIILDFLYWPFWWYSRGFFKVLVIVINQIYYQFEYLGLGVWIKNIFTPMYGMYDWESRIISFLVRVAQIIIRSIMLTVWSILLILILFVWLILPALIVYQIYTILKFL